MSRLQELIRELCPDGVENKALGEIGTSQKGVRVVRKQLEESGPFPVYQNSLTPLGYYEESNRAAGMPFVIGAGAAAQIGYSDGEWWAADDCFTFDIPRDVAVGRFVYYCLLSQQTFLKSRIRKASIPRLARSVVGKLRIPVPPIEVQREVVRILDEYTAAHDELVRQLEEEMALRKGVLEDVRDCLMLGDSSVPMLPFREYCASMNTGPFGSSVHKADYVDDGCPIVNPADIKGTEVTVGKMVSTEAEQRLTRYKLQVNDLVIGRRGEMGRVGIIDEATAGYLCGTGCFFVRMNDLVLPQYWRHFFSTSYAKTYLEAHAVGSTMKNLNLDILGGMPVPIPDLDRQACIIDFLNDLSSSSTEMADRLLSEIEYQSQQFALIRNQLLSFPEKVA